MAVEAGVAYDESVLQQMATATLEAMLHASAMGAGFLDFDNDGWPDIFMVNGHGGLPGKRIEDAGFLLSGEQPLG
jgi:hypothetical protein